MTVKELKEILNKYPEDVEVYFHDSDYGLVSIDCIRDINNKCIEFDCY